MVVEGGFKTRLMADSMRFSARGLLDKDERRKSLNFLTTARTSGVWLMVGGGGA